MSGASTSRFRRSGSHSEVRSFSCSSRTLASNEVRCNDQTQPTHYRVTRVDGANACIYRAQGTNSHVHPLFSLLPNRFFRPLPLDEHIRASCLARSIFCCTCSMKPDRDGAKGEARGTEDGSVELARQCLSLGESAGFALVGRTDLVAMQGEDTSLSWLRAPCSTDNTTGFRTPPINQINIMRLRIIVSPMVYGLANMQAPGLLSSPLVATCSEELSPNIPGACAHPCLQCWSMEEACPLGRDPYVWPFAWP